jgi:hypothetical protein
MFFASDVYRYVFVACATATVVVGMDLALRVINRRWRHVAPSRRRAIRINRRRRGDRPNIISLDHQRMFEFLPRYPFDPISRN